MWPHGTQLESHQISLLYFGTKLLAAAVVAPGSAAAVAAAKKKVSGKKSSGKEEKHGKKEKVSGKKSSGKKEKHGKKEKSSSKEKSEKRDKGKAETPQRSKSGKPSKEKKLEKAPLPPASAAALAEIADVSACRVDRMCLLSAGAPERGAVLRFVSPRLSDGGRLVAGIGFAPEPSSDHSHHIMTMTTVAAAAGWPAERVLHMCSWYVCMCALERVLHVYPRACDLGAPL